MLQTNGGRLNKRSILVSEAVGGHTVGRNGRLDLPDVRKGRQERF